jgi:hypothetical protein
VGHGKLAWRAINSSLPKSWKLSLYFKSCLWDYRV